MKKLKKLINEIFLRKYFYQVNIFSGTTRASEIRYSLNNIFDNNLDNGRDIDVYERIFSNYLSTTRSFSFSTGRMALYAILETLNIGHGDEVIIPAFTCVVVANAIIYTGAKPVYCDIETERFSLDPKYLELKITTKTKAIIAQHTFGIPCFINEIIEIGKKYNIPVIEDCAHALGGKEKGRLLGTIGYASFFSTDHTKVISTSIGGLATSTNPECLKKLKTIYDESDFLTISQIRRQICTYAIFHYLTHPRIYWLSKYFLTFLIKTKIAMFITDYLILTKPTAYPFPSRLSNIHAQIGISQLNDLIDNLESRKKIANEFETVTKANKTLFSNNDLDCAWLRYPILIENRDAFLGDLNKYYDFGIWFTTVTECRSSKFSEISYSIGSCPTAEKITQQIVSIPTHTRVKPRSVLIQALKQLKETPRGTFIYERNN